MNSEYLKFNKMFHEISYINRIIVSTASLKIYVKEFFPKDIEVLGTKLSLNKANECKGIKFNNYGSNKIISLKKIGIS